MVAPVRSDDLYDYMIDQESFEKIRSSREGPMPVSSAAARARRAKRSSRRPQTRQACRINGAHRRYIRKVGSHPSCRFATLTPQENRAA